MNNSGSKKSEQLGLNYSTAQQRLKKKILFHLVQKLKEDICFRCGNRIENEKDLSIEHKKAWLDVSNELFWDLENVAFSHLSCNIGAPRTKAKECSNGHEFTVANTRNDSLGYRDCRACDKKRWHTKNRALERKIRHQKKKDA